MSDIFSKNIKSGRFRAEPVKCIREGCDKTTRAQHCYCRNHRPNTLYNKNKYKENYAKFKDKWIDRQLKYSYGITYQQYATMLEGQNGVCKICLKPEKKKRLAVDHNHSTGRVRGLLCENCNRSLGLAQESTNVLKSMIKYLEDNNE